MRLSRLSRLGAAVVGTVACSGALSVLGPAYGLPQGAAILGPLALLAVSLAIFFGTLAVGRGH